MFQILGLISTNIQLPLSHLYYQVPLSLSTLWNILFSTGSWFWVVLILTKFLSFLFSTAVNGVNQLSLLRQCFVEVFMVQTLVIEMCYISVMSMFQINNNTLVRGSSYYMHLALITVLTICISYALAKFIRKFEFTKRFLLNLETSFL